MNWFKRLQDKYASWLADDLQSTRPLGRGWFGRICKLSAFDYTQSLESQLRALIPQLKNRAGKFEDIQPVINKLNGALKSLSYARRLNDPQRLSQVQSTALTALRDADAYMRQYDMYSTLPQGMQGNIQQLSTVSPQWNNYLTDEHKRNAEKVTLVPGEHLNGGQPGPDQWVRLEGLEMYSVTPSGQTTYNPTATYANDVMGDWISVENDGAEANVYVRGTDEAWSRFVDKVAPWMFPETKSLKNLRLKLPSESEFNQEFAPDQKEIGASKPMDVVVLNADDNPDASQTYEPSGAGSSGFRLMFDPSNSFYREDFPQIVKMIQEVGNVDPRLTRVDAANGMIDVFDVRANRMRAAYLYGIARSLESKYKYQNASKLNAIIKDLMGGINRREAEEYKKTKNPDIPSPKVVQGRLAKNINKKGPRIASRFFGFMLALGIDTSQHMPDEQFQKVVGAAYGGSEAFDPSQPYGPDNWAGPFGSATTPSWQASQSQGMAFVASRKSSVIADEPGSGKTIQAIIGADIAREEGKKVLVMCPNMLVAENWTGDTAKGPTFACGHDRSQIAEFKDVETFNAAMADPNIIWVVMGFSRLSGSNENTQQLQKAIRDQCFAGAFSSLIIDEIQTIKNPKSVTAKKINKAIPKDTIPSHVGLTGTPSDNDPTDIFTQLMFLNHPLLFSDKGRSSRSVALDFTNPKVFANEYLGGASLADTVTLSKQEREDMTEDQQEDELLSRWTKKAHNVLSWVQSVDEDHKQVILELFASTYMRRNKEDIRPEIATEAPLERNAEMLPVPDYLRMPEEGENWHNATLLKMARAKAPMTVAKAVQHLSNDPTQHIFIVTKHPDVAEEIAAGINQQSGGDVAKAVHGETEQESRGIAADTFRDPASGLRAVVYSMKLGAVGLNFDNATKAIFNDMDWNPSNNLQAEQRVHRITSNRPVDIEYMVYESSYDQEMFERVMKKKTINDAMSNLIRASKTAKSPDERIALANEFVRNMINNILLDVGLTPALQDWFEENMDLALQNQPIQSYQDMVKLRQEQMMPDNPLDSLVPDWLEEDYEKAAWKQERELKLDKAYGESWREQTPFEVDEMLGALSGKKPKAEPQAVVPSGPAKARPRAKARKR